MVFHDVRRAVRSLLHARGFTAVAVAVLALGIGAATAIFSVVDAVVLRGLPFDEHDRLVAVLEHDTKRPKTFGDGKTTSQTYLDWRSMQQSFDRLALAAAWRFRVRNEAGEPDYARAQRVTSEFFSLLGVKPLLGDGFTRDNEVEGRHRVVLLSYGFWQRRFGGAPNVVGRTITLNDEPWEILGVLPRSFAYPIAEERPTELYSPIAFDKAARTRGTSRNFNYVAIGRLKPGVSAARAQAQMQRVAADLDRQYPKWAPGRTVRVISLQEHLVGKVRPWMLMLLGAVGLLLLIACVNVANLMLARATVRSREIAVRSALGAGRWRLVRELMAEALLLALAGAALGVALAAAAVRVLRLWLPAGLPRVAAIGVDVRVLAAASAAAVATALVFGLVPAIHASRTDLRSSLNDDGRGNTSGTRRQRLRAALVVAEVALAFVLVAGSALFAASFARLVAIDIGFDHHRVLVLDAWPILKPGTDWKQAEKAGVAYVERMLEAVGRVPGITAAAAVSGGLPLTGSWSRTSVTLPGRGELKGDDDQLDIRTVSPGYLRLMGIPLRRGRVLGAEDRHGGQAVVVVNEAAARRYWPGQDPLNQRVTINDIERIVVGVVGDIRHLGPEAPPRPECYVPMSQEGMYGGTFVMRTSGDPLALLKSVKTAMWSADPALRFSADEFTLDGYMDRLVAERRFLMALVGIFGLLGLAIATAGIYGVLAYIVAQRTSEIGVRMALGATPLRIVSTVVGGSVFLVAGGLAVGGAASWYLAAGMRAFLFDVEPLDRSVMAAAVGIIALTGLLAALLPARRAALVHPVSAMRRG